MKNEKATTEAQQAKELPSSEAPTKKVCGLVMPISTIDSCSESHWLEVKGILSDAISRAGFEANLVSNADDIGLIHKRIIQNLYDNPVVVCDVSAKNPNVMFELGLRLAFDKPTLIVKDDKTSYSFDTSGIEHLSYPRDLRYSQIVEFKERLTEKISATFKKSTSDPSYTTFLKNFGEFTVAKLDKKEIPSQEYIIEALQGLQTAVSRIERRVSLGEFRSSRRGTSISADQVDSTRPYIAIPIPSHIIGFNEDREKLAELIMSTTRYANGIGFRESKQQGGYTDVVISTDPGVDTELVFAEITKPLHDFMARNSAGK